jgi:putative PEP-CTERM system TPR-repeat lipoprotein
MRSAKPWIGGFLIFASILCLSPLYRAHALPLIESPMHLDGAMTAEIQRIQRLIREKQLDEAMRAVAGLEKSEPNNPTILNLKGGIYLEKKDLANARRSFERAFELDRHSLAAAMNLAQLDLHESRTDAARARFQAILAKEKSNVQAMIGLAGVAAAARQETEYIGWLEKAAAAAPSAARPRVLLVHHYLQKREAHKALAIARQVQSAHPHDADALDALGAAQLATGEIRGALATYGNLAKALPQNAIVHYRLASAQAAAGDNSAARASLEKALALAPAFHDAEMLLAAVELGAGRHAEALKIAQQIQKKRPQSASGPTLQGDILMAQKNYAAALKAYETALALNNTGLLAVKVHQALSAAGRVKEADTRLAQWLKTRPEDTAARSYLAGNYIKANRFPQAIEQYEILLAAHPGNVQVLNNLAWLYHREKDARALATAERAYRLAPHHPEVMDTLGTILIDQGQTRRGLQLLQKAATEAPASTAIRYHLAVALAKSGDRVRARKVLEDLLANHANFPQRAEAQALLRQL